jgi:Flp pilus assembly pilin Flp
MTIRAALGRAARRLAARARLHPDRGASAVEYGIMVFLVAAVVILAVVFLGQATSQSYSCTAEAVATKSGVSGCG